VFEEEVAFVGADPRVCPKDCKQSPCIKCKQSYLSKHIAPFPTKGLFKRGVGEAQSGSQLLIN